MKEIPAFKLVAEPLSEEAKNLRPFEWAGPIVGTRHRLGGKPEFLQKDENPVCSCGDGMTFYGQLDSINDEFIIADCGMIFIFLCFSCYEVKAIVQSG